jgi:hypothetical protein
MFSVAPNRHFMRGEFHSASRPSPYYKAQYERRHRLKSIFTRRLHSESAPGIPPDVIPYGIQACGAWDSRGIAELMLGSYCQRSRNNATLSRGNAAAASSAAKPYSRRYGSIDVASSTLFASMP